MRAFEFRLQTKLDITLQQEELARVELVEKQAAYDREMAELQRLEAHLEAVYDSLRGKRGGIHVDSFIITKDYVKFMREQIDNQYRVVEEAEQILEIARFHYMELVKERKALEKLYEREFQEYLREVNRAEQTLIDEVALSRFWRAERGGSE